MNSKKLIVLCGGQTGGPVAPLLALTSGFSAEYVLVDVAKSSGATLSKKYGIEFQQTFGGKAPRYVTWRWPLEILKTFASFVQAVWFMLTRRPALLIGAGGFTQVPWGVAAWLCRVPLVIHQQDVLPTWSNQILARLASLITVVFVDSVSNFRKYSSQVITLGNPSVTLVAQGDDSAWKFADGQKPNLLVVGGGGGAASINDLVQRNLDYLTQHFNVLHVYGNNQSGTFTAKTGYESVAFLTNFREALAQANLVISRAGLGAITDIVSAHKPSLILPIPHSHQVANALWLNKFGVCKVLNQENISDAEFINALKSLLVMQISSQTWQQVEDKFPTNGVVQKFWNLVQERKLI